MDARRFDRNADQLAQIIAHITQVPQYVNHQILMDRHHLLLLLDQAIKLNDKLGKACEKGLI
tara:strand:+ start:928 stop:1113 length:186 start_codon:yes stop_codon:yes gene_type:complete